MASPLRFAQLDFIVSFYLTFKFGAVEHYKPITYFCCFWLSEVVKKSLPSPNFWKFHKRRVCCFIVAHHRFVFLGEMWHFSVVGSANKSFVCPTILGVSYAICQHLRKFAFALVYLMVNKPLDI